MSIALVTLLLSMIFLGISASGFVLDSKDCADDRIGYSVHSGQELFFINGDLVDKSLFCNALQGKKLLVDGGVRRELAEQRNTEGEKGRTAYNHKLTTVKIGMAGTGIFALCCISLCSCFFKKRKPAGHTVLSKDVYSNSVSSFGANSSFERVPPSPLRAIASPRQTSNSPRFSMSPSPRLTGLGSIHLNFNQVAKATQNFSPAMKIGKGGFGIVYKGHLDDGRVVAIKRAKRDHFKDQKNEFSREVELLAKIDHQNLVKLLGFIDKGDERLIITEYVPNGTLRVHLDGRRGRILDFNQRLGIAIDVAHGLTYLHMYSEKQIIHRDVKSSNILLTNTMRAKVADFGFARLGAEDSEQSHVNTVVKGTVGYLDPEYMKSHQLTAKSDVYSFGILLLEILTSRRPVELKRPIDERVTLIWVFKKLEEGNVLDLVDPKMEEAVDGEILMRFFELAIQCAAPVRADRPDMKLVGEQLWGIRAEYHRRSRRG
ncbi:hypothetical protein CDL15_Pgr015370 [Punica granatum]|uniref:non-specific serine/threonine protein kinase n=1 Tax=Punica granatum TaxID=22663 RepID=A0A218VZM2_PUNGR|nr:hypothetical protein CDL15_Pgr015370 [Punica granatum]